MWRSIDVHSKLKFSIVVLKFVFSAAFFGLFQKLKFRGNLIIDLLSINFPPLFKILSSSIIDIINSFRNDKYKDV